jgi:hypothetical protein
VSVPWIKLWVEARTDKKLDRLTDAQHRVWFNLLLYAAEQDERGTFSDDGSLALEVAKGRQKALDATIDALRDLHIIVEAGAGRWAFKAFDKRQNRKPSDSTEMARERKRRQREREAEQARIDAEKGDVTQIEHVTPLSRPVTRDAVTCHAEGEVEVEVEEDPDQPPVPSMLSDLPRKERGSYPQADDPTIAIECYVTKLRLALGNDDRDLTADEILSAKRWVHDFGSQMTCVGIGYAAQDGFITNPKRVYGQIRALATKTAVTA